MPKSGQPKPEGAQQRPADAQPTTKDEKPEGDGNAGVVPEIRVQLPENFLAGYKAANEDQTAHNSKTRLASWLTFGAVLIYTAITACQWQATRDAVIATQQANELTRQSVRARIIFQNMHLTKPVRAGEAIRVAFNLKNIGRSEAFYGVSVGVHRWIALPEDPNLIATPVPDKVMEPDAPMDAAIFDDVLPTQGYLDDLPRAEVYGPPTHLTTYFLGRVIYESLGRSYENDFCVYLVRRSTNPFATDLPEDFGDPNYMFMKCSAERNGQHEIQQKTGR